MRGHERRLTAFTVAVLLGVTGPANAGRFWNVGGSVQSGEVRVTAEERRSLASEASDPSAAKRRRSPRVDERERYRRLRAEMFEEMTGEALRRAGEAKRVTELERLGRRCLSRASSASGRGGCVRRFEHAMASLGDQVHERRDAWEFQWASLNRQAHDAWKHFSTTCTSLGGSGSSGRQRCSFDRWRNYRPGQFVRTVRPGTAAPPIEVVLRARDAVTPPPPIIRMNPAVGHEQIVHFPTWMWIEGPAWQSHRARAEAGSAWAEAEATPRHVTWRMGNGDTVVCDGPGWAFDPSRPAPGQRSDCTYEYRASSDGEPREAFVVSATVTYNVEWSGANGSGGRLDDLERTSSVPVRVAEIQALKS